MVHTFQEKEFEWRKFQYLPSYRHYQTEPLYACLPEFQGIPETPSNNMTDKQLNQYDTDLIECYFAQLKTWISSVFGLVMSVP
ncbi:TPA: hypothetical protein QH450_003646 [Providencia alcalifaciens]|nr:hypothetical protein [Providencia alcalifaciens]